MVRVMCDGDVFCVLVTFHFQLSPLASSNVKTRAECVSLSLPVQSLSFDKPYAVPPCSDTGNLASYGPRLNYKDWEEVCPRHAVCRPTGEWNMPWCS